MPASSLVALVLLVLLMFLILLLALDLVLEHIRTNGTRRARGEGTEYAAAELVGAPGTGCAAYQCRPETSLTVGTDGTSWASGARGTVVVLGMAVGVMVLGLLVLAIARLLLVVLRLLLVMLLLLLLMRGSTVVGGLLRMRGVAACVGGLLGVLLVLRLLGVLILLRIAALLGVALLLLATVVLLLLMMATTSTAVVV